MGKKERKKRDKDRRRLEDDTMHDAKKDVGRQRGDEDVDDEPEELLEDDEEGEHELLDVEHEEETS